jgi:hypothetical protein
LLGWWCDSTQLCALIPGNGQAAAADACMINHMCEGLLILEGPACASALRRTPHTHRHCCHLGVCSGTVEGGTCLPLYKTKAPTLASPALCTPVYALAFGTPRKLQYCSCTFRLTVYVADCMSLRATRCLLIQCGCRCLQCRGRHMQASILQGLHTSFQSTQYTRSIAAFVDPPAQPLPTPAAFVAQRVGNGLQGNQLKTCG